MRLKKDHKFYETLPAPPHTARMTRNEINISIKKNGLVLLRLVGFYLFVASLIAFRHDHILPPRIARFVSIMLHKLEKATYFLVIATAPVHPTDFGAHHLFACHGARKSTSIIVIIMRLKRLIEVLSALPVYAARMMKRNAQKMGASNAKPSVRKRTLQSKPNPTFRTAILTAPENLLPP